MYVADSKMNRTLLSILLLAACARTTTNDVPPSDPGPDISEKRPIGNINIGMYFGENVSEETLASVEKNIGHHIDRLLLYRSLDAFADRYPSNVEFFHFLDRLWQRGTELWLTWTPPSTLAEVEKGTYDAAAMSYIHDIASVGAPVWISFAPYVNGSSTPYSVGVNPAENSPEHFRNAWWHLHYLVGNTLFQDGADDIAVRWVLSFAAHPVEKKGANGWTLDNFWPGDSVVDAIALNGFNQVDSWPLVWPLPLANSFSSMPAPRSFTNAASVPVCRAASRWFLNRRNSFKPTGSNGLFPISRWHSLRS